MADEKQPNTAEHRDPMGIGSGAEWDRRGQIAGILRDLESGNFTLAALLVDLMTRDDRIAGVKSARIDGLLSAPVKFDPATIRNRVTGKARAIADEADEAWPRMAAKSEVAALVESGLFLGIGVCEIVWTTSQDRWTPRLKWWHPQFIGWDWTERRYYVTPESAERIWLPRTDREIASDGKWVVFTPFGYSYAWMRGLVRPLAMLYLRRQWNQRDTARFNEVYGQLVKVAVTPAQAPDPDKNRFARSIRRMSAETTIEAPEGFDFKIVGAGTTSSEMFLGDTNYIDASIGAVWLGQNASGEKVGGLGDAQFASDEHRVREKQRSDAAVYDVLRHQLLSWWTLYNFGDAALTPFVSAELDPPETVAAKAQPLATLATALDSLAKYGADTDAILEDVGVPMLPESERPEMLPEVSAPDANGAETPTAPAPPAGTGALEVTPSAQGAIVKVNEARAELGLPPLTREDGTRDPDGELTIAEFQAKRAASIAKPAAAEGGETAPATPADAALRRAWARNLLALADNASPRRSRVPGKRATYPERLAYRATLEAQEASEADLAAILTAVREATSPADLKARLQRLYSEMSPGAFAKVTERALLMGEMAGRLDLLQRI